MYNRPMPTSATPVIALTQDPLVGLPPSPADIETLKALSYRARDLSLSITNPATLSRKLRESLIEMVGPDRSQAFHIAGSFNGSTNEARFEIAHLGPNFVSMIGIGKNTGAEIGMGYRRTVGNGWEVDVGVAVSAGWTGDRLKDIGKLAGTKAEFSITIAR